MGKKKMKYLKGMTKKVPLLSTNTLKRYYPMELLLEQIRHTQQTKMELHSSSFNSFGHSADEGKDIETDEQSETGEDGDNVVEETISDNIPSTQEYEDIEEEREELEENIPFSIV